MGGVFLNQGVVTHKAPAKLFAPLQLPSSPLGSVTAGGVPGACFVAVGAWLGAGGGLRSPSPVSDMCEQAARYCRSSVHKLLQQQHSQSRPLDGLLRWIVTKMTDKTERELRGEEALSGVQGNPGTRRGISVILDVSTPDGLMEMFSCLFAHTGSCVTRVGVT